MLLPGGPPHLTKTVILCQWIIQIRRPEKNVQRPQPDLQTLSSRYIVPTSENTLKMAGTYRKWLFFEQIVEAWPQLSYKSNLYLKAQLCCDLWVWVWPLDLRGFSRSACRCLIHGQAIQLCVHISTLFILCPLKMWNVANDHSTVRMMIPFPDLMSNIYFRFFRIMSVTFDTSRAGKKV